MKFCLLGPTYPLRGGISQYTTFLFLELKKKHQVRLISFTRLYPTFLFPGKSQIDHSSKYTQVDNTPLLDSLNPWSWYRTAREIWRFSPDLLVIQWWHPFFAIPLAIVALLVKWVSKTRVCYLCHNVMPHDRSWVDRVLIRFVFHTGSCFVLHSKKDESDLWNLFPKAKVQRILLPTYSEFSSSRDPSKEEARKKLGLQAPMLLFFGFIRPYKGLIYLIKAMPKVLSELDCVLYVVGEFYEKKKAYLAEIEKLGIKDKVKIVDSYVSNEEVPYYFCAADVVILPYISATQSAVVQMAYAFEKPVITTDTGGLSEAVQDGETGLIVPPKDSDVLSQAIISFYRENKGMIFSKNILRFKEKFSWSRVREALEGLASKD